jgi:lysophospholipase L1-like esterase
MRLRLATVSVILVALVAGALPAAAESSDQSAKPGKYYLSLGDSLAFGFQQAKFNALFPGEDPAGFNTGYANDFAALLRTVRHGERLVNYGCPGETTISFINGPCPYPFALHNAYTKGSQLATAVDFLQGHRNQVNPITIDLGSNDALALLRACGMPPISPSGVLCVGPQVSGLVTQISSNLTTIITALHNASPKSEIIVLDLYNPLVFLDSALDGFASDGLAGAVNAGIANAATTPGARLADVFTTFNPGGATNPGNAVELATICTLTAICTALLDVHATDAGYVLMALKLWQASGFSDRDD